MNNNSNLIKIQLKNNNNNNYISNKLKKAQRNYPNKQLKIINMKHKAKQTLRKKIIAKIKINIANPNLKSKKLNFRKKYFNSYLYFLILFIKIFN